MRLFLMISFLLTFFQSSAQVWAGEWKGYYTFGKGDFLVPEGKISISIFIDSSNKVHSDTKYKNEYKRDTTVSRRMSFEKIGLNTIKLVELSESASNKDESLQTMILNLTRQKPPVLAGKWESHFGVATYKGAINLIKQVGTKK
jgi:hypothetical protein